MVREKGAGSSGGYSPQSAVRRPRAAAAVAVVRPSSCWGGAPAAAEDRSSFFFKDEVPAGSDGCLRSAAVWGAGVRFGGEAAENRRSGGQPAGDGAGPGRGGAVGGRSAGDDETISITINMRPPPVLRSTSCCEPQRNDETIVDFFVAIISIITADRKEKMAAEESRKGTYSRSLMMRTPRVLSLRTTMKKAGHSASCANDDDDFAVSSPARQMGKKREDDIIPHQCRCSSHALTQVVRAACSHAHGLSPPTKQHYRSGPAGGVGGSHAVRLK